MLILMDYEENISSPRVGIPSGGNISFLYRKPHTGWISNSRDNQLSEAPHTDLGQGVVGAGEAETLLINVDY